ncbi:hypothetical protein NB640_02045 [Oxalobacter vibrioformis]|uniref:Metallophosphoesterase n=1 Tax=Oxalobacter vibrioformis TaxID=933080 RepID=A0A9E9LZE8_9BURK|nr:hypothetical protein [Oxalobacter vibrioformis]WAW10465.1 hypothetical protein NB640_02045 [Oxalobacter vibrioformis]
MMSSDRHDDKSLLLRSFAYIALRLIAPLPITMTGKICAALLVLLISLKHYFFQNFFGGLASPDLPRIVIILSGWLYVTLTFLFVLLVIRDITGCLLWIAGKAGFSVNLSLTELPFSLGILLIVLLCSTYSLYEAIRRLDIKRMEVTLTRLPKALDGLTIVQITDLHVNAFNPAHKVKELSKRSTASTPISFCSPVILLTGQLSNGKRILRP